MSSTHDPSELSTRLARRADLPVLAVIERELARLAFPDDPVLDMDYHQQKLLRAMKKEPAGMVVLTTADDQDIVGWLWAVGKTALATGERYGVIRSLYVRPDLRRQGLGSALARHARNYFTALGIERIVAKTHFADEAGQRTLKRLGFTPLHVTLEWRDNAADDGQSQNGRGISADSGTG